MKPTEKSTKRNDFQRHKLKSLNIRELLRFGISFLQNFANPSIEAEVLLANVMKKPRTWLFLHSDVIVSAKKAQKYKVFVALRKKNVPVAYILQQKCWAGLDLTVNGNVLVPRPETETLLTHILADFAEKPLQSVLDVGTGSGCLAIGVKKAFLHADVTAIDVCEKALKVAGHNARKNKVEIMFLQSDLLENVPIASFFDVIVANLPYVPQNMVKNAQPDLFFEPQSAIYANKEGLFLIARLKEEIVARNIGFNALYLEFLPFQWPEIQQIWRGFSVFPLQDVGGDVYFAKIMLKD